VWKRGLSEKLNCWEVKHCGREPGGEHVGSLGVCPAALEKGLEGVHGGRNAGRACWAVAGTFCQGQIQGLFAKKYRTCRECDFYAKVHLEEGRDIVPPAALIKMIDRVLM